MPQIINTNISSLNSQRHLNNTQSALSTALERLSSGKRINSAKDDAAGLGISSRMTTQVNGMNQAIRNARDGISMGQTAEGALSTSEGMLQRIRTLAVQSSNATNASLDRQAIQDEVSQLAAELNRIAETTTFNGQKLLDGTMGTSHFQVGANAGELISGNGMNFRTSVYGNNRISGDALVAKASVATGQLDAEDIVISGSIGTATYTTAATDTAKTVAAAVNSLTDKTGVEASAKTEALLDDFAAGQSYSLTLFGDNKTKDANIAFTIGTTLTSSDAYAEAINAINAKSSQTGITAEFDAKNSGIKLTHATGENVVVGFNAASTVPGAGVPKMYTYKADDTLQAGVALTKVTAANAPTGGIAAVGVVTYDGDKSFSVTDGSALASTTGSANGSASVLNSVASLDVTTFDGAQLAIAIADAGINLVNKEMARYGALQARFESTIKNLEVNAENTTNARGRIQDADFAAETAELSRATILQQAGTAMLAQANQAPQNVLSLIQ